MVDAEAKGTGGHLVLVTGGVRSGKSGFGARCAAHLAQTGVVFVATAQVRDDEMAARVARHQAERPATWRTVEAPLRLDDAVAAALAGGERVVLVDSVDSWVANRVLEADPASSTQLDRGRMEALETALLAEAHEMVAHHRRHGGHLVLVSLEAGMGVVPPYPLGRAFRDLLGLVNADFAAAADAVYLLVAGLPVDVKRLSALTAPSLGAPGTDIPGADAPAVPQQ